MQVICISGRAEAGKTTVAGMLKTTLTNSSNSAQLSAKSVLFVNYADVLKYVATNWFNWNGVKDDAGRSLLQQLGTDKVRTRYPTFWCDIVQKLVSCFYDNWDYVIVGDCRFVNEITGWLRYNITPIWIDVQRPEHHSALTATQLLHPSERSLMYHLEYDKQLQQIHDTSFYTLHNESSLNELEQCVRKLAEEILSTEERSST